MVAVRDEVLVFAVKPQLMGPELVPVAPDVIVSQLPDVTDASHDIVPVPVLETRKVIVPAFSSTSWLGGSTKSTGSSRVPACLTVTSFGLPVAPVADTRIVPVRAVVLVLSINLQVIVPELLPLAPDVIESQLSPDVTAAVQDIVPVPLLETLNVAVPVTFATV